MAEAVREMLDTARAMCTSCAWFWDDSSRPKPVDCLRYAAHAITVVDAPSAR